MAFPIVPLGVRGVLVQRLDRAFCFFLADWNVPPTDAVVSLPTGRFVLAGVRVLSDDS